MTISSPANQTQGGQSTAARCQRQQQQQQQNSCQQSILAPGGFNPSVAFQQVKQTQASLARLTRVHQQLQCQNSSPSALQPSSSHNSNKQETTTQSASSSSTSIKPTSSFVDCLIRRFKDCFSEDACTVPMFVVGNLSPGSDGTHLILPPCVSLGRQNMNRFASPRNLRHMNSIRDSCKSIEELDLGGNKLTDLIEIYKILQCTPNLKFLNLSENDLSRTAPVAMAPSLATTSSSPTAPTSAVTNSVLSAAASHFPSVENSWTINQRSCLAPINQNSQQQAAMSRRRHSTLGQTTMTATKATSTTSVGSSLSGAYRVRPGASRVAEARRLAAANALAQSRKTSSSVASKLAQSASTAGSRGVSGASGRDGSGGVSRAADKMGSRGSLNQTSTMHLARSLSSLSAKDVAGLSSKARASGRVNEPIRTQRQRIPTSRSTPRFSTSPPSPSSTPGKSSPVGASGKTSKSPGPTSTGMKMFTAEPIAETDTDVDMATTSSALQPVAGGSSRAQCTRSTTALQSNCSNNNTSTTPFRRTFESIKALALNNTGCPWRVVCSILSRMPNLEELHLSLNNYERIDLEPQEFRHTSIKRLYLCNNPNLTNWEELNKILIAFPSLEALSIADCNISQIPDNLANSREWNKLCGLNINGWPIKEWPVIERLNQLPSLIDLKCRNLEILSTIDEPRHHLIARLPKLQRLNGSEIEEREHAEKAFLRFFMDNSHLERPARFHELLRIHGEVGPIDVDVDLSPPSQAQIKVILLNRNYFRKEDQDDILMSEDFLIKLMDNVHDPNAGRENSMDTQEVAQSSGEPVRLFKDEGQEVLAIEVDLRQSVRKFKSTLAGLFGLSSPQNLILYYIDHEMVGLMGPELIKHNQKKLWNYNVQDGDQFIVEER